MNRYVQHISGQGEKFLVHQGNGTWGCWYIKTAEDCPDYYLPKSDYVLCDPPERWVDVTMDCAVLFHGVIMHSMPGQIRPVQVVSRLGCPIEGCEDVILAPGYQLRKIDMKGVGVASAIEQAFIVLHLES